MHRGPRGSRHDVAHPCLEKTLLLFNRLERSHSRSLFPGGKYFDVTVDFSLVPSPGPVMLCHHSYCHKDRYRDQSSLLC